MRTGAELGDNTPAVKYNLEDHLNSSCMLLDANGTLINKEEYTPFGETSFGSYGRKRYRYNGKEKDEESGLYNYGMRYYAPWMCRFVSVDPIAGEYMKLSPYQYSSNNPINGRDIDGLENENQQGNTSQDATTTAEIQFKRCIGKHTLRLLLRMKMERYIMCQERPLKDIVSQTGSLTILEEM